MFGRDTKRFIQGKLKMKLHPKKHLLAIAITSAFFVVNSAHAGTYETQTGEKIKTLQNENKAIVFICRPAEKQDVYKKLAEPKIASVAKDFGVSEKQLYNVVSQNPSELPPYVVSLNQYVEALDTDKIKEVFNDFLKSRNPKYLSILKEQSKKKSYGKDGKAVINDAMFAYGIVNAYFGNQKVANQYLESAAKKKHFAAGYVQGLRSYKGYGLNVDLTKAGNRMIKAFETVQKKHKYTAIPASDPFGQAVEATFLSLVLEPNFPYRNTYVDLLQKAEQAKQDLERELANSASQMNPAVLQNIRKLELMRNDVQVAIATAMGLGPQIQEFVAEANIRENEANPSAAMIETLRVKNDKMNDIIVGALAKAKAMDGQAAKEFEQAYQTTEKMIYATQVQYGIWLASRMASMSLGNMTENMLVVQSMDLGAKKTCELWNNMGAYAARVNMKVEPADPNSFSDEI